MNWLRQGLLHFLLRSLVMTSRRQAEHGRHKKWKSRRTGKVKCEQHILQPFKGIYDFCPCPLPGTELGRSFPPAVLHSIPHNNRVVLIILFLFLSTHLCVYFARARHFGKLCSREDDGPRKCHKWPKCHKCGCWRQILINYLRNFRFHIWWWVGGRKQRTRALVFVQQR